MANVFVRDSEFDFILIKKLLLLNFLEAVTRRFFVKKMFLEISQNSQENACVRVSCNFVLKETLTLLFQVNFAKFQRTPFLWKISGGCF